MKLRIVFATGNENKVREIREIVHDEIPDGQDISVISMKQAGIHSDPEETGTTFQENALIKARACAAELAAHPQLLNTDGSAAGSPTVVISDDSGLVVDALGGMPGIYSARYMGRDTSYTVKMNHILEELKDVEGSARSARFVCACAAVIPAVPSSSGNGTTAAVIPGLLLPDHNTGSPHSSAAVRENRTDSGSPSLSASEEGSSTGWKELLTTGTMEGEIAHEIRGANGFGYDPFFWLPDLGKTSAELTDEEKNAISHRGKAFRAMIRELKNTFDMQ